MTFIQMEWRGKTILFRKFVEDEQPKIEMLPNKRLLYKIRVVLKCVVETRKLCEWCDMTGLSKREQAKHLIEELYNLCTTVNPGFLKETH